MENYQLYRTNILLGGQMKYDIILDSDNYGLIVEGFNITPISDNIYYDKQLQPQILNIGVNDTFAKWELSEHCFNVKKFYSKISDRFYDGCINNLLNQTPPLPKSYQGKLYMDDYEMGCRRMSYNLYKKQLSFFCPVWLEKLSTDEYLSFDFNFYANPAQTRMIYKKRLDFKKRSNPTNYTTNVKKLIPRDVLGAVKNQKYPYPNYDYIYDPLYHNRFVDYLNQYINVLGLNEGQDYVINIIPNNSTVDKINKTSILNAFNVKTGTTQECRLSNLYDLFNKSNQRILLEQNQLLIHNLKDNNCIAKQLFNFNFCFNIDDMLPKFTIREFFAEKIYMTVNVYINNDVTNKSIKLDIKDFYSNHDFIQRSIVSPANIVFNMNIYDKILNSSTEDVYSDWKIESIDQSADIYNVLSYYNDHRYFKTVDKNKLLQSIIHWAPSYNRSEILNFYPGFMSCNVTKTPLGDAVNFIYNGYNMNTPQLDNTNYNRQINPYWCNAINIIQGISNSDLLNYVKVKYANTPTDTSMDTPMMIKSSRTTTINYVEVSIRHTCFLPNKDKKDIHDGWPYKGEYKDPFRDKYDPTSPEGANNYPLNEYHEPTSFNIPVSEIVQVDSDNYYVTWSSIIEKGTRFTNGVEFHNINECVCQRSGVGIGIDLFCYLRDANDNKIAPDTKLFLTKTSNGKYEHDNPIKAWNDPNDTSLITDVLASSSNIVDLNSDDFTKTGIYALGGPVKYFEHIYYIYTDTKDDMINLVLEVFNDNGEITQILKGGTNTKFYSNKYHGINHRVSRIRKPNSDWGAWGRILNHPSEKDKIYIYVGDGVSQKISSHQSTDMYGYKNIDLNDFTKKKTAGLIEFAGGHYFIEGYYDHINHTPPSYEGITTWGGFNFYVHTSDDPGYDNGYDITQEITDDDERYERFGTVIGGSVEWTDWVDLTPINLNKYTNVGIYELNGPINRFKNIYYIYTDEPTDEINLVLEVTTNPSGGIHQTLEGGTDANHHNINHRVSRDLGSSDGIWSPWKISQESSDLKPKYYMYVGDGVSHKDETHLSIGIYGYKDLDLNNFTAGKTEGPLEFSENEYYSISGYCDHIYNKPSVFEENTEWCNFTIRAYIDVDNGYDITQTFFFDEESEYPEYIRFCTVNEDGSMTWSEWEYIGGDNTGGDDTKLEITTIFWPNKGGEKIHDGWPYEGEYKDPSRTYDQDKDLSPDNYPLDQYWATRDFKVSSSDILTDERTKRRYVTWETILAMDTSLNIHNDDMFSDMFGEKDGFVCRRVRNIGAGKNIFTGRDLFCYLRDTNDNKITTDTKIYLGKPENNKYSIRVNAWNDPNDTSLITDVLASSSNIVDLNLDNFAEDGVYALGGPVNCFKNIYYIYTDNPTDNINLVLKVVTSSNGYITQTLEGGTAVNPHNIYHRCTRKREPNGNWREWEHTPEYAPLRSTTYMYVGPGASHKDPSHQSFLIYGYEHIDLNNFTAGKTEGPREFSKNEYYSISGYYDCMDNIPSPFEKIDGWNNFTLHACIANDGYNIAQRIIRGPMDPEYERLGIVEIDGSVTWTEWTRDDNTGGDDNMGGGNIGGSIWMEMFIDIYYDKEYQPNQQPSEEEPRYGMHRAFHLPGRFIDGDENTINWNDLIYYDKLSPSDIQLYKDTNNFVFVDYITGIGKMVRCYLRDGDGNKIKASEDNEGRYKLQPIPWVGAGGVSYTPVKIDDNEEKNGPEKYYAWNEQGDSIVLIEREASEDNRIDLNELTDPGTYLISGPIKYIDNAPPMYISSLDINVNFILNVEVTTKGNIKKCIQIINGGTSIFDGGESIHMTRTGTGINGLEGIVEWSKWAAFENDIFNPSGGTSGTRPSGGTNDGSEDTIIEIIKVTGDEDSINLNEFKTAGKYEISGPIQYIINFPSWTNFPALEDYTDTEFILIVSKTHINSQFFYTQKIEGNVGYKDKESNSLSSPRSFTMKRKGYEENSWDEDNISYWGEWEDLTSDRIWTSTEIHKKTEADIINNKFATYVVDVLEDILAHGEDKYSHLYSKFSKNCYVRNISYKANDNVIDKGDINVLFVNISNFLYDVDPDDILAVNNKGIMEFKQNISNELRKRIVKKYSNNIVTTKYYRKGAGLLNRQNYIFEAHRYNNYVLVIYTGDFLSEGSNVNLNSSGRSNIESFAYDIVHSKFTSLFVEDSNDMVEFGSVKDNLMNYLHNIINSPEKTKLNTVLIETRLVPINIKGPTMDIKEINLAHSNQKSIIYRSLGGISPKFIGKDEQFFNYKYSKIKYDENNNQYNKYINTVYSPLYPSIGYFKFTKDKQFYDSPAGEVIGEYNMMNYNGVYSLTPQITADIEQRVVNKANEGLVYEDLDVLIKNYIYNYYKTGSLNDNNGDDDKELEYITTLYNYTFELVDTFMDDKNNQVYKYNVKIKLK